MTAPLQRSFELLKNLSE